MDTIEIDLCLKGGPVYATFVIEEPDVDFEFVERLLCDALARVWNFEGKELFYAQRNDESAD